jgi:hypothetical protein
VRARGFEFAPEPLGSDDQGREVLSFIPGETLGDELPWPGWVWDDRLLIEVGRATARYHRAVADFRPAGRVPWQLGPAELQAEEIVCHHDIAPYNVVTVGGQLNGVIDWDLIGPGSPRSDLAFVAWQWVPLQHPVVARAFGWQDVNGLARRLRLLLDSYGLHQRDGFVDDVIARIHLNRDGMLRKAAEGAAGYVRLVEDVHIEGMNAAIAFVSMEHDALQAQLS